MEERYHEGVALILRILELFFLALING